MIFYFSGTGNSRWVAETLAWRLGESDRVVPISKAFASGKFSYELNDGETLGFVFPTYSWGPAPVMIDFVRKLELKGYTADTYCYIVPTCGDDAGYSVDMWKKGTGDKYKLNAAYTVIMPNNYILLPGFDVDDSLIETRKKRTAIGRVEKISRLIKRRSEVDDVLRGSFAWIKSRIINPWFKRHCMSDKKFVVDTEKCIKCGICATNCPVSNITMKGGAPTWNGNCAMCLSCIHRCPERAIEYGKATQQKGRYVFSAYQKPRRKKRIKYSEILKDL